MRRCLLVLVQRVLELTVNRFEYPPSREYTRTVGSPFGRLKMPEKPVLPSPNSYPAHPPFICCCAV